jgi:glycosyltransferase involved in cell wall biosynthesis
VSQLSFSIVICTRNRSAMLADVIASLRQQEYPPALYEILVVDNASTDDTRQETEHLQQFEGHPIRYIYEPRLGLSYARNTGAEQARGDIVVYIDDDAIATPGWLTWLAKGFELDPNIVGVGGGIELQWEGERPSWLPQELESYLACTAKLDNTMRVLDNGVSLIGCNMAFLRSCFGKVGGFSIYLGAGSSLTGFGEEDEFCQRLWRHGKRLAFVPEALVYHRVFPERMTRRYMLHRGRAQGLSDVVILQLTESFPRWKLFLAAGVDTAYLARDLVEVVQRRLTGLDHDAFTKLIYSASRLGRIQQEIRLSLLGPPDGLEAGPPKLNLAGTSCLGPAYCSK